MARKMYYVGYRDYLELICDVNIQGEYILIERQKTILENDRLICGVRAVDDKRKVIVYFLPTASDFPRNGWGEAIGEMNPKPDQEKLEAALTKYYTTRAETLVKDRQDALERLEAEREKRIKQIERDYTEARYRASDTYNQEISDLDLWIDEQRQRIDATYPMGEQHESA